MAAEDSSVPLTSNKREALTCALCLEIFRDPRLLPCSHTFCKKCLDDLRQQHPDGSFPCPSCRKRIKVSAEGSSGFQSNFYIDEEELERARNVTACSVHLQKQLEIFCLDCDLLLCVDCKLTVHLHHRSQTLQDAKKDAEKQLSVDKTRIGMMKDKIQKRLPERNKNLDQFKTKKAAIEKKIRHRHATLVAEADKYLKEALESLEDACSTTENSLSEDLQIISGNVKKLDVLEQKIDRALQNGDSCTIVNTATDVRTGCGSIENLERMEVLPLQSVSRPVHEADIPEDDAMFVSMKNFIGRGQQMTYVYTHAEVRVTEEVCCGEDDDSVVLCVCPGDKDAYVSFDSSYKDREPCDKHLVGNGKWIPETDRRSCSHLYRGGKGYIYIPFSKTKDRNTYVKHGDPDRCFCLKTNSDGSEGNVRLHKSGWERNPTWNKVLCVDPFKSFSHHVLNIECGPHRAVDTNSAADLFAVVEEPRTPSRYRSRKVKLFRRAQSAAIATYQSPLTPCQPADVCFFMLEGQEVLLVADELNDAIHVVEVKDGCLTFSRFLTPGCPLLVQPTALNIDPKGRLWVGCRGGRLLTVQHAMPEDDDDDEMMMMTNMSTPVVTSVLMNEKKFGILSHPSSYLSIHPAPPPQKKRKTNK